MKSVLFTTNVPAPYTVQFFEMLGHQFELTVLYERKTASNRDKLWFDETGKSYKEVYLSGIKIGEETACCPSVIRYLKKKYDIIIIGNYASLTGIVSILYLTLMHKKFYVHVDGGIKGEKEGLKKYLKSFLLSRAEGFFSPGLVTDEYIKYYAGNTKRIYHYPFSSIKQNEIVSRPFNKKEKKEILKKIEKEIIIRDSDFIISSVGSVIPRKGYDILLQALKSLKYKPLVFIIGGIPTADLRSIIEKNKLDNVHFVGFKKHELIKNYLRASDLFVLPTRYDIWGLVINEALASGIPVITSDKCVAGIELIQEGKNGYIFENENSDDLSKCIEKIMSKDDASREEMGINSIQRAQSYTIEQMSRNYGMVISELLHSEEKNR